MIFSFYFYLVVMLVFLAVVGHATSASDYMKMRADSLEARARRYRTYDKTPTWHLIQLALMAVLWPLAAVLYIITPKEPEDGEGGAQ